MSMIDEVGGAADLDQAAIERAHPRGVAGGEAKGDFGRRTGAQSPLGMEQIRRVAVRQ